MLNGIPDDMHCLLHITFFLNELNLMNFNEFNCLDLFSYNYVQI